ncbi:MAG: helix-hairpin-helix domain-containing protein [Planctomycetota bacterium]
MNGSCGPQARVVRAVILAAGILAAAAATGADALVTIEGCTLVPADWADGDSFRVRTPAGEEHTVRLYAVDCLEHHVSDETAARRLRSQRRYFGIAEAKPDTAASIEFAKQLAAEATAETRHLLAKPFILHTSFADGRGDARFRRIYGFVTSADGHDLAEQLVSKGLARAFCVARSTPAGDSGDEYRERLADFELQAASRRLGIWAHTDWDRLPAERRIERMEARELQGAIDGAAAPPAGFVIDPNTASRGDLMRLPGVGETLANRIIERRPYRRVVDLLEVEGIGPAKFRELKPLLRIEAAP